MWCGESLNVQKFRHVCSRFFVQGLVFAVPGHALLDLAEIEIMERGNEYALKMKNLKRARMNKVRVYSANSVKYIRAYL